MPQFLKILLLVLIVNLLYLGFTALAKKLRGERPYGSPRTPDEREMKRDLLDPERSNRRDFESSGSLGCHAAGGCCACGLASLCQGQDSEEEQD